MKRRRGGRRSDAHGANNQKRSQRRRHEEAPSRGPGRSRAAKKRERLEERAAKPLTGRVQKNPRGFAFILPETPGIPDAYVARGDAASLLNDDRVEYTVSRRGDRMAAKITRILARGQKEVLGTVQAGRHGQPGALLTAEGEMFHLRLDRQHPPLPGEWVIADIEHYPTDEGAGRVGVRERLGAELLPSHDYRIAIARFGLSDRFPSEALEEAERGRERAAEALGYLEGRRDLRHLPIVTIDGPDAKDFDDAVLVETPEEGPAFRLYVAIADVSYFVREGTALDREALTRGTSVYLPGLCLPMLPEALSNDLCSLRPQSDRLALTAEIDFDRDGNTTGYRFYEAVIKTVRRLTYDLVHAYIEGDALARAELAHLEGPLSRMQALHRKLRQKRRERGVLDFDLPECQIRLDGEGMPVNIGPAPRYESHKWIEEMMIAANRVVAKALRESGTEAVYRVHEAPDPRGMEELNLMLRALGVSHEIHEVTPKAFSRLLEATAHLKGAATIHQAVLRKQKQARYTAEPLGHFGLALKDYTHFTSPIRRYPDLLVHRALKRLIHRDASGRSAKSDKRKVSVESLDAVAQQNSEAERRAMEAERFVVKRKQCWFMQTLIGEEFDGIVAGVSSRGAFVSLPQFALEGFLSVESMGGHFEFDERKQLLRRRPGHDVLSVGDKLRIRVERVSLEDNEIEFALT